MNSKLMSRGLAAAATVVIGTIGATVGPVEAAEAPEYVLLTGADDETPDDLVSDDAAGETTTDVAVGRIVESPTKD